MSIRISKYFLASIIFLISFQVSKGQVGLCPPNLDFEAGDFSGWECRWGLTFDGLPLPNIGPQPGRHTIIDAATAGTDFYGGFPELCPNGSGYSVKLGNNGTGRQSESVSYTYTIPPTLTVFSMIFHYAVVLQNPNHSVLEQPRFQARIIDMSTGNTIPCVTFDFTATTAPGGFLPSPNSPPNGLVVYKGWTPITVNLNAYIGRTIRLEFITNDCTLGAHFGYAYLDVNTNCNGAISGTNICVGDNAITLTAPFGFQSYAWYTDNTFTTILSTNQTLPLNPAPTVGTVFPVIVTPYPGFGCIDTLYATIGVSPKPVSNAGADVAICKFQQAQLGGASAPTLTYEWTPASQVSNPTISNPLAWNIPPNPTEFIVKTTDILTGCFSYDTTIVSNVVVDNAITATGNLAFCDYGLPEATLSVNNTSSPIQWYNNSNPVAGATGAIYQPMVSGDYWAQLTQNGCTDSTQTISIAVHPLPQASFTFVSDSGCVTDNSFLFTNTSSISDNSSLQYNWKFSDGVTLQTLDAVRVFDAVGNYNLALVISSAFGCKDSTAPVDLFILPNGVPNFKWDSVCRDQPVLFTNLSKENGSVSVSYNWSFDDGNPSSPVKDPSPVTYLSSGIKNVVLEMTTLGCENDPQSLTKKIKVNAPDAGVRYRTITVPEGSSKTIHVRDSVGSNFLWKPQVQLSSYTTRYTEFFATANDVEYQIDITDENTCVTTDTILMQVLKKPGYYLPTAFTPNGDGLNDVARPYLVRMKSLKSFSVFNRWGNLIFYTTTEGEGWDGTYKGMKQDSGVYVWILEFMNNDNKLLIEKGTITIIR